MKIMLSNAPWHKVVDGSGFIGVRAGSRWPHKWDFTGSYVCIYRPFPFYLATASTMLRDEGYEVLLRDSIVIGERYEEFYDYIGREMPDVLLMEISTPSMSNDVEVAREIKRRFPELCLIFTGFHAEIADKEFLRDNPYVDFTIYGEYEFQLVNLLNAIRDRRDLSTVNNLVYREADGDIKKTGREMPQDITFMAWPDRDNLPAAYYDGCCGLIEPQIQVHTSRGCPFHCNFCAWPQMMYGGSIYRKRDPQDVVNEILANLKKVPYKSIYIDDDTINVDRNHVLELARLFKENGLDKIKWGCMGRADLMDEEVLEALRDAGCYSIKYGVESFNQSIIDKIGKSMNVRKNIENIKKTREYGIKVHLTYALGLMGDTKETIEDTIEKAMELTADSRQFSIATPFFGSEWWNICEENHWLTTKNWDDFDGNNKAVVDREELRAEELEKLRNKAEAMHLEQMETMIPAEFTFQKHKDELKKIGSAFHNIILTCTNGRGIVKEIFNTLDQVCDQARLLSSCQFRESFAGQIDGKKMIWFSRPDYFKKEEMKDLIQEIKKSQPDCVLVPGKSLGGEGYENVLEVAKEIAPKVLFINEYGEFVSIN